jgi:hypothetical protein
MALNTFANAVIPLFSRRSRPAENYTSFKSLFSLSAYAIISPPSGPSPQLVTFKHFNDLSSRRRKSKLLIPAGPNALSDRFTSRRSPPWLARMLRTSTSSDPGSSCSLRDTNMSLKFTCARRGAFSAEKRDAKVSHASLP